MEKKGVGDQSPVLKLFLSYWLANDLGFSYSFTKVTVVGRYFVWPMVLPGETQKTFCRCHHNNYHHRQRAAEICGQHGAIVPRVDSKPTGRGLRDSLALFYRFGHQIVAVMVVLCVNMVTTNIATLFISYFQASQG